MDNARENGNYRDYSSIQYVIVYHSFIGVWQCAASGAAAHAV